MLPEELKYVSIFLQFPEFINLNLAPSTASLLPPAIQFWWNWLTKNLWWDHDLFPLKLYSAVFKLQKSAMYSREYNGSIAKYSAVFMRPSHNLVENSFHWYLAIRSFNQKHTLNLLFNVPKSQSSTPVLEKLVLHNLFSITCSPLKRSIHHFYKVMQGWNAKSRYPSCTQACHWDFRVLFWSILLLGKFSHKFAYAQTASPESFFRKVCKIMLSWVVDPASWRNL